MKHDQVQPTALASADFDEDGVADLVSGYAGEPSGSGSGILTLHRGNVDAIYRNALEAQQRKAKSEFTDSPFLGSARVFGLPEAPDFIGAGDFNADGHWDVIAAARGSNALYLLRGDGRGGLGQAQRIELAGRVTAMVTGEINRRDGLVDIVVAVAGADGPKALVFEGPDGALRSQPEIFALPAEATALALGQLDDDYYIDLAIAAGSELLIVHGRDRRLSLDEIRQAEVSPAIIDHRSFQFRVVSIAVGDFTGHPGNELALLSDSGQVHLLGRGGKQKRDKMMRQVSEAISVLGTSIPQESSSASLLVPARISSLPHDDLLVVGRTDHQLRILTSDAETGKHPDAATLSASARPRVAASLDVGGEPVAALPMRLNKHALSDLGILRKGKSAPVVALTTPGAIITVNDTADTNTRDTVLTLREAILVANGTLAVASLTAGEQAQVSGTPATPGLDEIRFNIPGSGVKTISPTSALPDISDPVTIDGTTQPGFAGSPIIELNGASAGSLAQGLFLNNVSNCSVSGLVINRFAQTGIYMLGGGSHTIEGNFIGTDSSGTVKRANGVHGLLISGGSTNTIGGTTAAARNIISGNFFEGVIIASNAAGNILQGNFIGTDVTGTVALGNGAHDAGFAGVVLGTSAFHFLGKTSAPNNIIGGTAPGARNVISANGSAGLIILNPGSTGNLVQGNYVGTDLTGTVALGNGSEGVLIVDSPSNTIGGTAAGAGNVISANKNGVFIVDSGATGNVVQGNLIGTNGAGTLPLANRFNGVYISASNNVVGGSTPGAGNLISGNRAHGVHISGIRPDTFASVPTTGNMVQGNRIGTDAVGAQPLANSFEGVFISDNAANNLIGGTASGEGNRIAFNGSNGVLVGSQPAPGGTGNFPPGNGNAILSNSIFSNIRLGIDLGPLDGVTPNDASDADSGPNGLQNFPVLTSVSSSGGSTTIQGTLNSTPTTTFTLQFFSNTACDNSGFGEGQSLLGSTMVTTNGSGNASFNVTFPIAVASGQSVTATATDPSNNTSEFSACAEVCTITCPPDQTANTGPGATQCGAIVNYPLPTTTGACGTVTCSPASASFFPVGTTTVNCTTGSGQSCSFTVTVVDNTPPNDHLPGQYYDNNGTGSVHDGGDLRDAKRDRQLHARADRGVCTGLRLGFQQGRDDCDLHCD